MKSELIVNVQSDEISIALTEDDRLMEVSTESKIEATFAVGNIYYGRVKKVMPALNAVFVDVGYEKEAFLHYLDLGPQFLTLEKFTQFAVQEKKRKPLIQNTPEQKEVGKQGSIADVCRVGQDILVQVTKEPINTKGPRLTAEISLAGRNIVLIPFGDKVMVSNKIRSEAERSRLKQLIQAIKPDRFGVIVRTVAEGKRVAELDAELRLLVKRWEDMVAHLQKAKPVSLVQEEIGRTIGVIRDVFTPEFESIQINDAQMYEEVKSYVSLIAPESEKMVHLYEGEQPIFDHFQITRQMKTGLGRTVGFKNGGYLIMERTEALFSIDVNSGSKKLGADQEDNAFRCNMLAADEIYHQLRLRDIGGIIIVDFIDMDSPEHRQLLFEHMRTLMKRDRARHNVLQLSKFGLMQITRQRVRPVVEVDVQEECPTCQGKGRIQPSLLFTDVLDEQCELYKTHFGTGLKLFVHPFIYAYASQGFFLTNLKAKWRRHYGVRLIADESLPMLSYRFVNKEGKKMELPRIAELSIDQKADEKAKLYAGKKIEEKPEVKLSTEQKQDSAAEDKTKPAEMKKTEVAKPIDAAKADVVKPVDAKKKETANSADTKKTETAKPADTKKTETAKPADTKKTAKAGLVKESPRENAGDQTSPKEPKVAEKPETKSKKTAKAELATTEKTSEPVKKARKRRKKKSDSSHSEADVTQGEAIQTTPTDEANVKAVSTEIVAEANTSDVADKQVPTKKPRKKASKNAIEQTPSDSDELVTAEKAKQKRVKKTAKPKKKSDDATDAANLNASDLASSEEVKKEKKPTKRSRSSKAKKNEVIAESSVPQTNAGVVTVTNTLGNAN